MKKLLPLLASILASCSANISIVEQVKKQTDFAVSRAEVKDFPASIMAMDTAINYANLTADGVLQGSTYYQSAHIASGADMVERASEHFLKAIDLYANERGFEQQQNVCYFEMIQPFVVLADSSSIAAILPKMEAVAQKCADEKPYYQYFIAKAQYFTLRINSQRATVADLAARDSALYYYKRSLAIFDRYGDDIIFSQQPSLNAYNIAVNYFYQLANPSARDSVQKYMTIANDLKKLDDNRTAVSLDDLQGWLYYFDNEPEKAKELMTDVVSILDSLNDVELTENTYQAYLFLVMLYEDEGDYKTALDYQRRLVYAHEKRFNSTREEQLRNIAARYEVDKKEATIEALELKSRNFMIFLAFSFLVVVLLVVVVVYRRRIYREKIYQAVLEAEMSRQEVDNLKSSARPSLEFFDKFFDFINHSALPRSVKDGYMRQFERLDITTIEKQFMASKQPLTPMDRRYILCFIIGIKPSDIATIFNIEVASVHMVRYRIKKKFSKNDTWNI